MSIFKAIKAKENSCNGSKREEEHTQLKTPPIENVSLPQTKINKSTQMMYIKFCCIKTASYVFTFCLGFNFCVECKWCCVRVLLVRFLGQIVKLYSWGATFKKLGPLRRRSNIIKKTQKLRPNTAFDFIYFYLCSVWKLICHFNLRLSLRWLLKEWVEKDRESYQVIAKACHL